MKTRQAKKNVKNAIIKFQAEILKENDFFQWRFSRGEGRLFDDSNTWRMHKLRDCLKVFDFAMENEGFYKGRTQDVVTVSRYFKSWEVMRFEHKDGQKLRIRTLK